MTTWLGVRGRGRGRGRVIGVAIRVPTLPYPMHNPTLSPNPTLHQVPTDFMDDAAPGPAPVAAPMVPGEVPGRGPVIPGEVPSRGPAMVRPLVNPPHPATAPPVSSRPGVVRYLP